MPTFLYEALNEEGSIIRGLVEAETRNLALSQLKAFRFQIRNLREQTRFGAFLNKLRGVSGTVIALFTRQLATMILSGLPLMRALDILSRHGENRRMEDVILLVREHIRGGETLSQAMSRYHDVFSPVYLALVRAGEVAGEVGEILERMADYLEKEVKLRKRVTGAMMYPLFIFGFCVTLAFGLITYIFPRFVAMFEGLQVRMPFPTRVLMLLVATVKNPFFLALALGVLATLAFFVTQYIKTPIGRRHFHQWLLTAPIFGPVNRKVAIARFCRTFSTLFGSGIPILQALEVVSRVSGNEMINEAIFQVQEAVKYGSSISAPLEESGLFPIMATSMIQVGEQTGYLQAMLSKIADYYDTEVELGLLALTKLVEPVLIGVMGCIVGFVVISIFLPIYQLISSFNQ